MQNYHYGRADLLTDCGRDTASFKIIDKLRKEGRSIIYISHKLEEIFEIADEITVMRDGQLHRHMGYKGHYHRPADRPNGGKKDERAISFVRGRKNR